MKKILVVLLVLAVAGGVFAQEGSWNVGGSVEVGSRLDFDPDPSSTGEKALVDGYAYNNWDVIRGALAIGYTRDNFYLGFSTTTEPGTEFTTSFDGDNFRAKFVVRDVIKLLSGGSLGNASDPSNQGGGWVKRLWGEFKFFNGIITVLPALKSDAGEYWISDKTGTFLEDGQGDYISAGAWRTKNPFDDRVTFTYVDEWYGDWSNNFLLVGADVGAISLGIIIPKLFLFAGSWSNDTGAGQAELVEDSLKQSVFGLKFTQAPIEFAVQFQLENYGVYFGGQFFTGPITVGLSFQGLLDSNGVVTGTPTHIKFGGKVNFDGSGFGGGVKAFYENEEDASVGAYDDLSKIGIEPYFFYDAIPSHLRFVLDIGFYFLGSTDGTNKEKATVWAVQPQIFWNFLGTGAGTYWSINTGIIARYRLARADLVEFGAADESVNFFDVVFKWSF